MRDYGGVAWPLNAYSINLFYHENIMNHQPHQWKVGELAKLVGVSVRALHHYDEVGLLKPSRRSDKGYRLYDADDLMKLQLIKSLQQLGFSLEQIKHYLTQPESSLLEVIPQHIKRLEEQIAVQKMLCEKLSKVAESMKTHRVVSPQEFIQLIHLTTMTENYYTSEQMAKIKAQGEKLGPEKIREVEAEWPKLIAAVKAEMDKGTPPEDPVVQKLAARWTELVEMFTGGDPGIAAGAAKMWKENGDAIRRQHPEGSPSPDMFPYIQKAQEHLKKNKK